MDTGTSLITKVVDEGRLQEVLRNGITEDFLDQPANSVFSYIKRHFNEYKGVPTRDAVLKAFPNFEFNGAEEPLEYYIDLIKEDYRRVVLEDSLSQAADIYYKDTKEAEKLLRNTLKELSVTQKSHRDIDIAKTARERIEAYDIRKSNPGVDGISSGWKTLDNETLGWHPEEFIVLAGEKYKGKSWIMIWWAYQAMLQNERVLIATKEMSQRQISQRFDSVYSHVPFDSLRKGMLTNVEEKRYKEKLIELEESPSHFIIAREGVNTVEDIRQKAIETDATIVFCDSVYLFPPDDSSQKLGEVAKRMEISHKCKDIAASLGIPFVVSVQAGRRESKKPRKPTLDDIEWSNAFSQDAETVVFLQVEDLDHELNRAQMYLLKSRDGQLAEFFINRDFNWMEFPESDEKMSPTHEIFQEDDGVIDYE